MTNFDQTIGKSFTREFCTILAHHLTRTLQNMSPNKFERFWCDGITAPEAWNQEQGEILPSSQIATEAWLGYTGQEKYQMIFKLGKKSIYKCISGSDIYDCLPDDHSLEWIDIDPIRKVIVLRLL